jgi:hypothetical protein
VALPEASRCAVHPDSPSVEICSRCGAFVCASCLEFDESERQAPYCAGCYRKEVAPGASGRAVAALVVGIMCLSLCPPGGLVAWLLAEQELSAIARGEAPMKGRNLARGARVLGIFELGLTALAIVVGAVVFSIRNPLG